MVTLAPGIETPPLILGGNTFGWTSDEAASFAVLDAFVGAGGKMIDTADMYSNWVPGNSGGESEAVIGRWLKQNGRRDVMVTTKVGMLDGEGGTKLAPARIAAACDASLQRLGVETIDLYLAHQDDEDWSQEEVADAFDRLVKAGKVRAIGASNFTAERLASALDVQQAKGAAQYRVLQNEYNLMARDKFEGAVQDVCVERGVAMTPYYGLASGYLTGKYRSDADLTGTRSGGVKAFHEGKGPQVLAALDSVKEETGAPVAAIALAWLAAQPGVAAPIASATSPAQLEQIAQAMTLKLSDDQVKRLDDASK